MNKDVRELLDTLKIKYKDISLYIQALSHPSYENETKNNIGNYQRLEFVGDAVIQYIITFYIYESFKDLDEGGMSLLRSNLVRMETLYGLAKYINLQDYILLGKGEEKGNGRESQSLISDVFEAFIAAIYLNNGYEVTKKFALNLYNRYIKEIGIDKLLGRLKDPKTLLQEFVASDSKRTVKYVTVSQVGPANKPEFEVEVYNEDIFLGRGKGPNKHTAEENAAKNALEKMAK